MFNVVELFSGIGSQAKALRNLGVDIELIGTCEWDVHAIIAYDLIHNDANIPEDVSNMSKEQLLDVLKDFTFSNTGKTPLDFTSLKTYSLETLQHLFLALRRNHNYVDVSALKGNELPGNIDLLTYSFPCQDLSNVGAFHGYNKGIDKDSGSRSSLLWQVGRILSEMKEANIRLPRFLLMENVPTLLSKRHFSNFTTWIYDLRKLGYVSKYFQLNASDFGLPQNRPRLLMISVYVGNNKSENDLVLDYFRCKDEPEVIEDYQSSPHYHKYSVSDMLRTNYSNKKIFDEAVECVPNDTVSRKKIWDENPQIVLPGYKLNSELEVVRTITTKQDRNPNSGNLYFDCGIEGKSKFRYLTPRECMLFMGFTDQDFRQLKNNSLEFHKGDFLFARDKVIRMAGNSIPVKMLEGIFLQILQIDAVLKTYREKTFTVMDDTFEGQEIQSYIKRITKYLFKRKIRCRQPGGNYPESPDVIFPRYKTVLYIYDCFQHGHNCRDACLPVTNKEFWKSRIQKQCDSDTFEHNTLRASGWHVLIVWKCKLAEDRIGQTLKEIEAQLRRNVSSSEKDVG